MNKTEAIAALGGVEKARDWIRFEKARFRPKSRNAALYTIALCAFDDAGDEKLRRLREWCEREMVNDSWWRPCIVGEIDRLLAEPKEGA